MTNQEIFSAVLHLVGENPHSEGNEDYAERAPYLIAAACYRYAFIDESYRLAYDMEKQKILSINCFPLSTLFPLSDVFAPPVSLAVAGMLVLEENPKMSDQLLKMADAAIADIQKSIPFRKEKVLSHYVF